MVFPLIFKLKEEKPPEEAPKPEERLTTFENFLKEPETKKLIEKWTTKKGQQFTKRGITKLLHVLWIFHGSNKNARKAAEDILSSLVGDDALGKLLNVFYKLVPEGLMKKIVR